MDKDGEDDSTTWIGMGRMTAPHMDRDGEDDSTTRIGMVRMTAPNGLGWGE
jgi:hypothetical protein